MNLSVQPGLHRRLAYGEYIRSIHNFRHNYNLNFEDYTINYTINQSNINSNNNTINTNTNNNTNSTININSNNNTNQINNTINGLTVKQLLSVSIIKTTDQSFFCPICYDDNNSCYFRSLICNHDFHVTCIDEWLANNNTCPICRFVLS